MGLVWSMENILGWRSQYDRMKRWAAKLRETGADQEQLDLYLAFFLNCYSLRDWFIKSDVIGAGELDSLIGASEAMRLCRDLCNRSKHLRLTQRPSTEADFSIAREYAHEGTRFLILFLGRQRDLFQVAAECVSSWEDFLNSHNPPEPESPF